MFATSTTYNGNLGGVAGADAKCMTRAAAGGLTGTYVAWISAPGGIDARDRVLDVAYERTDGVEVAANLAQLSTEDLSAPINHDEFGVAIPAGNFDTWTGTNANGLWFGGSDSDCSNWSVSSGNGGITGGTSQSADVLWTAWNRETCNNLRRLYCFKTAN